jgi:hypothetical protein
MMPLSEHEKRLLDEIEQTLRSDDPRLASSLRSARPVVGLPTLIALGVCALGVGIALIAAGLALRDFVGTTLAVAGYALIVGGADCCLRATGRVRGDRRRQPGRRRPGRRR